MPDHNAINRSPGGIVSIVTWFLGVTVFLSVLVQLSFRLSNRAFRVKDDVAICIAAVFFIGQAVAVSFAAANGIGSHASTLTAPQLETFCKAIYAADVLFFPVLCAAQGSALFLVESIQASKVIKRMVRWLNIANLVWSSLATIIVIFRSKPIHPWTLPSDTFDMRNFLVAASLINIMIELLAIAIPTWVIVPLQLSRAQKVTVLTGIFFRIFVVAALIVRLVFTPTTLKLSEDPTYNLIAQVLASQVTLSTAIVTTSIPVLNHFLDYLDSGMLRMNDSKPTTPSVTGSYELGSRNYRSSRKIPTVSMIRVRDSVNQMKGDGFSPPSTSSQVESTERGRKDRRLSESSDTKGILKTVTWDCVYDNRDNQSAATLEHGLVFHHGN